MRIQFTFLVALVVLAIQLPAQKASVVVQTGHFKDITCAAYSRDSKLLATGGKDNLLLVYDANTALQMAAYNFFGGQLKQVQFTADSKKVMGLSSNDSKNPVIFALIDISKNDTVYAIRYSGKTKIRASEFRLSYDEKILALRDDEEFYFFDFTNGKLLYDIKLDGNSGYTELWQFTHDDKKIVCEDEKKGNIQIVDLTTKTVTATYPAEVKKMGTLRTETGIVSANDKYYLRCRGAENWYKYDLSSGALISKTGPEKQSYGSPTDYHVTADGKTLIVHDLGQLHLFETESGKLIKTIDHSKYSGSVSAISEDGKKAVICTYNLGHNVHSKNTVSDLLFVDLVSGRIVKRFSGTPMRPTRVLFSNNSKNIAIASNMPYKVWNLQTADGVKSLPDDTKFDEKNLSTIRFSPDDQVLFASDEAHPDLVNLPTLEMKEYKDHFYHNYRKEGAGSSENWITVDNQFDKLISGDGLYKMSSGEFMCKFEDEDAPNHAYREFTPDGKYAVAFSENRANAKGVRVYVYSLADCKKVADYVIPVERPNEYDDYSDRHHAFSKDSKRAAIINRDYNLFDLLTGKIIVTKKIYSKKAGGIWDDGHVNGLAFSPDDSKIAVAGDNNDIAIIETSTGKLLNMLKGHQDGVNSVNFSSDGNMLVSSGEDGKVILWNTAKASQVATFIGLDSSDYIVTTPDNYYMSTKKGLKGVGFRVGNKMFPVEQFDLRQNRPDTVLQRIGIASKVLIKMYRMAWLKRLKKAGFTPQMLSTDFHVPDIEIADKSNLPVTTSSGKIKFKVKMSDSLYTLEKYNVYVNNVPVYGARGFLLKDKNLRKHAVEISVDLNSGANTVLVSAFNSKGAESARETFEIYNEKTGSKPDLYVLAIGVSQYAEPNHDLKFAVKDAGDFINALKTGNSYYANVKTKTIFNKEATLNNIEPLRSFFKDSKPDDQVIVYFSGHGLLDEKLDYYLALHDVQFNDPSKGGLPYDVLESLIDSVPARNRLAFIDACHSGEVDKEDLVAEVRPNSQVVANARSGNIGVKPKAGLKNSFDYMNMLFSDVQRGSGTSVISAAGGLEFALESQDWNNGVFTYSIINGLKNSYADYNKDGNVNLSELKRYIGKTVFELTNGKQNPTMRKENAGSDMVIFAK